MLKFVSGNCLHFLGINKNFFALNPSQHVFIRAQHKTISYTFSQLTAFTVDEF